jgi:hypothetical protein
VRLLGDIQGAGGLSRRRLVRAAAVTTGAAAATVVGARPSVAQVTDPTALHITGDETKDGVLTLLDPPALTKGFVIPTTDPVANYSEHAFTVPWNDGGPGGVYPDHVFITGYNVLQGSPRDPNQIAIWLQLEHQFRNGPTAPFAAEVHWNFRRAGSATIERPWGFTVEHLTGRIAVHSLGGMIWLDSTGATSLMQLDEVNKQLKLYTDTNISLTSTSANRGPVMLGATPTFPTFYGRAGSTQTNDLMVLQRSDSAPAFRVGVDGAVAVGKTLTINTPTPSGAFTVQSGATTQVPILIKGAVGQTASLLEMYDAAGNRVVRFSRTGHFYVVGNNSISGLFGPAASGIYAGTESNHLFYVISNNLPRTRWEPNGNIGLNQNQASYGNGVGVIAIGNATTPPTGNPFGGGILFSENGALKWRGSSGTVTVVAPA